ncbi:MAG: hypothetical protein ACKOZW_12720, partial [Cyanobium sp.]
MAPLEPRRPIGRQGDLFSGDALAGTPLDGGSAPPASPPLLRHQLLAWQERVGAHQGPLFARADDYTNDHTDNRAPGQGQGSLFLPDATGVPTPAGAAAADPRAAAAALDPLRLAPQSLSFWRW